MMNGSKSPNRLPKFIILMLVGGVVPVAVIISLFTEAFSEPLVGQLARV